MPHARPGEVEVEVLRIGRRIGLLDDRQRRGLRVRERADHVLARVDVQRRLARRLVGRRIGARAGALQVRERPAGDRGLGHRLGAELPRVQAERLLRRQASRCPRPCRGPGPPCTPVPVRSKSKSCGSDAGSVTLTTFSDACFVFVNVHTTFSPASMSSVAVRSPARRRVGARRRGTPGPSASSPRPWTRSPSWRRADRRRGRTSAPRAASAFPPSVSRSRSAVRPVPVRSKSKSCGSDAGSVTLTTLSEACFVFVNVHTTFSPASMSSVALRVASSVDESAPAPVHSRSVSVQPAHRGLGHRLGAELARVERVSLLRRQRRVAAVRVQVQVRAARPSRSGRSRSPADQTPDR